jgi:sporulation protein YlmC with PRC-barrel domain
MKRSTFIGSIAVCMYFGLAAPLLAAEPVVTGAAIQAPPAEESGVSAVKPAKKCLSDLHAFDSQMEKDGHWLVGSGYGYGYPAGGTGFGYGFPTSAYLPATATGYQNARPGYEIRILVASAHVLARHGQQQPCEDVLATTRSIYNLYVTDLRGEGARTVDMPGWRQQQIAAAQPVTSNAAPFRSDELLGTEVLSQRNEDLGSVDDIVMSPQTGKIVYLVIARGGIFGIDEKYVPVPWQDFKTSPNANLLVLDTGKDTMKNAPRVSHDQFTIAGHFKQESQKVDAYWKVHLSD